MDGIFNKLRNLDAYPKINEDFYSRTLFGGVITLVSSVVMILLFFSEFSLYLHTVTETNLLVDTSRGGKLRIKFDITFPEIQCSLLTLDAMDISGEQHLDIKHDITKFRINVHGKVIGVKRGAIGSPEIEKPLQRHGGRLEHGETYCGSCYGAEMTDDDCCNSCEEVREAYKKKGWALTNENMIDQCKREDFIGKIKDEDGEGCNIYGKLEVNKVAGHFHFIPGKSFHRTNLHVNKLLDVPLSNYNISHKIHKLTFGDSFPGVVNPLNEVERIDETRNGVHQYFIKVVPTIYTNIGGQSINSNQYSVTEHFKTTEEISNDSFPGIFFYYDLSPIKVQFKEQHISFLHFITNLCAVIGGIFTIAGIVDSLVYNSQRAIKKKKEIGKFT